MFDADRPIINCGQDKLNRTLFAKYLARCMLDHKDPDSLVVGLYGGWGTGKTSVINMVVEELNFASSNLENDEKPVILNFSPWSYSGQGELIYNFFRRLSSALRRADYLKNADEIIYLLEMYVSYFTQKPIPTPLRAKRSLLDKLFNRKMTDSYAWESGRDLTEIKAALNQLLANQKHKIIIIIDNISRMHDEEIKQLFQIVKSMGDYANTAYLLAMDKELVIDKLSHLEANEGEEYVEKVVQLPFEVPPILQEDLETIFLDKMQGVVDDVPEGAWNIEYWAEVYYGTLRLFFNNCRDITRYINILKFSYSRLRDVVNPVDFFALTAIEVFTPEIYFGIRDNKDLFTDLLDNVYELDEEHIRADKLRCEEVLSRSQRIPRDIMLNLIIQLFPHIRRIYNPNLKLYHSTAKARELRRICSPDLFDAYFRLSMQAGHIHATEFETILSLSADKDEFEQALTRLNQDNRILQFLDRLDSNITQTIPKENFQSIINGLLDNGDLFPQGASDLLSLDTSMRIHRIIHALLERIDDTEDRFILLQNAISNSSKSLHILVHEVIELGHEHMQESDTYVPLEYRDLSPEQLGSLQKLVVSKIRNWEKHGSLDEHPRLISILYAWLAWENKNECQSYVKKLTGTDKGLVIFLSQMLKDAVDVAAEQYYKDPAWVEYISEIELFIPASEIEPRAKAIFENDYFEKLREHEQLAIMLFLDLMKSSTTKIIPKTTV